MGLAISDSQRFLDVFDICFKIRSQKKNIFISNVNKFLKILKLVLH